ncbi:MAG: YdbH domain-containing protein [Alishewanella sp.]|nr:YdbH domain-containing protein [Alishewanella sp.]
MRRLLKILAMLLLALPVLLFIAWFYLHTQLKMAGISSWSLQLAHLSWHQANLNQLDLVYENDHYRSEVSFHDLKLRWSWPGFFRIQAHSIQLASATITVQQTGEHVADTAARLPVALSADWRLPTWLPKLIKLDQIDLLLPCASGQCALQASLVASADEQQAWQASLSFKSPQYQQTVKTDWQLQQGPDELAIQATLLLDQQLALSFKQQLAVDRAASTELALAISPPSPALLAWLNEWDLQLPDEWREQFTQPVQLHLVARWQLPELWPEARLATNALPLVNAEIDIIARAPDAFIIPNIGWLKGELKAQLQIADQHVAKWQLAADLALSHYPDFGLKAYFADPLAPLLIKIDSQSASSPSLTQLPLKLQLSSASPVQSSFNAQAMLSLTPELAITLNQAELMLKTKQLQVKAYQLKLQDVTLQSRFLGAWQAKYWQLQLADNSSLAAKVTHPDAKGQVKLALNGTTISQATDADVTLSSQLQLLVEQLQHAQLLTQNWQWQGNASGSLVKLDVDGVLSNDSGLIVKQQTAWKAPAQLQMDWQLEDLFLLAGNPLATSFQAWPSLLNLTRGRINAYGQLSYQQQLVANAQVNFRELTGLYNRTLFTGLTSAFLVNLKAQQFTIEVPELQLAQLNHGLQMGPLQLKAQYQATLAEPILGNLQLLDARLGFMQGELSVEPQLMALKQPSQQLVLIINQLDLAELVRQHPTTELKANGKLSGRIPLTINNKQFSVQQGQLAAEAPGGTLQYRSAASAASAKTGGMKIVFDALENFQFSVLNSELNYATDGKLTLALQLKGANPALQQGRAINLNINLEEDLPAMLASLQLANKLNDTLTKRVQQYIQRQQAAKAAAGEKR